MMVHGGNAPLPIYVSNQYTGTIIAYGEIMLSATSESCPQHAFKSKFTSISLYNCEHQSSKRSSVKSMPKAHTAN